MNNLILFLNWILNWMGFYRYSMFEWIIEIYRPCLITTSIWSTETKYLWMVNLVKEMKWTVGKQRTESFCQWFKICKLWALTFCKVRPDCHAWCQLHSNGLLLRDVSDDDGRWHGQVSESSSGKWEGPSSPSCLLPIMGKIFLPRYIYQYFM